ncbi:MAG: collagen-like protein, partial [Desulfobulbales bacterium]
MGKLLIRKWGSFFLVLMLAVSVSMLTGCSGDDGAPGPPGADGAPGAPGVPSTTNESCNVCHGADKVVDIAVAHPAPLIKPIVSNIRVTRSAADALTVTFRVDYEDEDGVLQPLPG